MAITFWQVKFCCYSLSLEAQITHVYFWFWWHEMIHPLHVCLPPKIKYCYPHVPLGEEGQGTISMAQPRVEPLTMNLI